LGNSILFELAGRHYRHDSHHHPVLTNHAQQHTHCITLNPTLRFEPLVLRLYRPNGVVKRSQNFVLADATLFHACQGVLGNFNLHHFIL